MVILLHCLSEKPRNHRFALESGLQDPVKPVEMHRWPPTKEIISTHDDSQPSLWMHKCTRTRLAPREAICNQDAGVRGFLIAGCIAGAIK